MDVGLLIKEIRLRAGLSQNELAGRLGTSQSAIARWESGAVSPRFDTLRRIAAACGQEIEVRLTPPADRDRDQILERLRWTPDERLTYLLDMLAFEEQARGARRAGSRG